MLTYNLDKSALFLISLEKYEGNRTECQYKNEQLQSLFSKLCKWQISSRRFIKCLNSLRLLSLVKPLAEIATLVIKIR